MSKTDRTTNIALAVLCTCAVAITATAVHREFFSGSSGLPADRPQTVSDWRRYAAVGARVGEANAPVTITVFSDFTCGACAVLSRRLNALMQKHPKGVSVVYRHFPLAGRPLAQQAAAASECAAAQGRFAQFKDTVFSDQESMGHRAWTSYAAAAGVTDTVKFRSCLDLDGTLSNVRRDMIEGNRLGVSATPTYLINETKIRGTLTEDSLDLYVTRALKRRGK